MANHLLKAKSTFGATQELLANLCLQNILPESLIAKDTVCRLLQPRMPLTTSLRVLKLTTSGWLYVPWSSLLEWPPRRAQRPSGVNTE